MAPADPSIAPVDSTTAAPDDGVIASPASDPAPSADTAAVTPVAATITPDQSGDSAAPAMVSSSQATVDGATVSADGSGAASTATISPPSAASVAPQPDGIASAKLGSVDAATTLTETATTSQIDSTAAQVLQSAAGVDTNLQGLANQPIVTTAPSTISQLTIRSVAGALSDITRTSVATLGQGPTRPAGDSSTAVRAAQARAGSLMMYDPSSVGGLPTASAAGSTNAAAAAMMTSAGGTSTPSAASADGPSSGRPAPGVAMLASFIVRIRAFRLAGTLGARGPPVSDAPVSRCAAGALRTARDPSVNVTVRRLVSNGEGGRTPALRRDDLAGPPGINDPAVSILVRIAPNDPAVVTPGLGASTAPSSLRSVTRRAVRDRTMVPPAAAITFLTGDARCL